MSLVAYSSDEEDQEEEEGGEKNEPLQETTPADSPPSPPSSVNSSANMATTKVQASFCSSNSNTGETSVKLPNASQLFASFDSAKESLAVNIPGGTFTSTKRSDRNGSFNGPPNKIPKGSLTPVRIIPDTAAGTLLPPQLRGRSNVATEDLDKLFSRKRRPT